jgi:hypothetical protein
MQTSSKQAACTCKQAASRKLRACKQGAAHANKTQKILASQLTHTDMRKENMRMQTCSFAKASRKHAQRAEHTTNTRAHAPNTRTDITIAHTVQVHHKTHARANKNTDLLAVPQKVGGKACILFMKSKFSTLEFFFFEFLCMCKIGAGAAGVGVGVCRGNGREAGVGEG